MKVPYDTLVSVLERVVNENGIEGEDGRLCASLFADASRDGVYSHGLNRFPRFINDIKKGTIDVNARATLDSSFGSLERWNGNRGPGNLNAYSAMKRAIEKAKENTVGIVALRNTNHWMRAGNYGLMAADNDCIGIMWTNTMPNMTAWGGKDVRIGNNPIVFAVPHGDEPVIVDCAMSLFSYGKLETLSRAGKETPVDAGYDSKGNVSRNPGEVASTMQVFPIGYWKGSGLSIVLDLIAASLAGGDTTRIIGERGGETEVCQVFIAISLSHFPDRKRIDEEIGRTLEYIKSSTPRDEKHPVHTPGEGMRKIRQESMISGVTVDDEIWNRVLSM